MLPVFIGRKRGEWKIFQGILSTPLFFWYLPEMKPSRRQFCRSPFSRKNRRGLSCKCNESITNGVIPLHGRSISLHRRVKFLHRRVNVLHRIAQFLHRYINFSHRCFHFQHKVLIILHRLHFFLQNAFLGYTAWSVFNKERLNRNRKELFVY